MKDLPVYPVPDWYVDIATADRCDGHTVPLAEFVATNLHDEESMAALIRLIRRECDFAPIGGGSLPLYHLSLVSEPSPTRRWPWQIPAPPPASR